MNRIDEVFKRLRGEGRKAFIPFVTAGDPDLATTLEVARVLAQSGASILEIGFPYSDPIADGPVIQASYTRALAKGLKLDDVFACARQMASDPVIAPVPRVAMVSFSLVHRRGPAAFLDVAKASGFSGLIVPDLPADESDDLARLASDRDLSVIQLVTPTTPRDRAVRIAKQSTGFLYCVSVAGITGERDRLPPELSEQLAWLRKQTDLPLCVGFGISKPEHVRALRDVADGVIVGSAIVRVVESAGPDAVREQLTEFVRPLVACLASRA